MVTRYFPTEEYETRWRRAELEMEKRGHDVAVVWGISAGIYYRCADILYLTNYFSNTSCGELDTDAWNARAFSAVILERGKMPELHMDEDLTRTDLLATDNVAFIGNRGNSFLDVIKSVGDALNRRGTSGRVAFVGSHFLPIKYYQQLVGYTPKIEWLPEDNMIEEIRIRKSPREIELYREAGVIASQALNRQMEALLAGKSEREAAAAATEEVVRNGGAVQRILIAHGKYKDYTVTAPITGYGEDIPQPGDMFHSWVYGPMKEGYWLDPGRTSVCGRVPSAEQREVIETAVSITERLIEAIQPGVRVKEVAQMAVDLENAAGADEGAVGESFPYHGHGLGMFWERPFIGLKTCEDDDVFEEDMVLGVEVRPSRPGIGFAGFEQNLVVKPGKNEILTTTPMLYW